MIIRGRLLNGKPYVLGTAGAVVTPTPAPTPTVTYATTFSVSSPTSMTVNTAATVMITPVSGSWNGQLVTPRATGLTGSFSPASATGSGTTAISFQFTATAAGTGVIDATATGLTSTGGQSVTVAATTPAPAPSGPMSQTFTVTNWSGAASLGVFKRGVWFKKGDVPVGSFPVLSSGAAQFYALSKWKDGSLKTARLLVRDAGLAAGASRAYTMTVATASVPTGSVKAIGNAGLVAALSGHDFKVTFSNTKDYLAATYNGGTLTASLNSHAAIGTRWEVLSTGATADVWQGWGMAAGTSADAHLKVNWYITRWKNADGSTLAFQVGAVPALDWWAVAGKTDLTYDAVLADGATTILSFPGVSHYYHSQWFMCINDGSSNAARAPWVGAATPTLDYTFDKTYAILSNVVHPLRRDKVPPARTQYAYVPCKTITPDGHRYGSVDAGGGYSGRGPITAYDSDAFMLQTPTSNAISRLNALTGLSISYHYRSDLNRTRSGEAADMANTNIPLIMRPKAASYYDFTAQGLPTAIDAYRGNGGSVGWVQPNQLTSNGWGNGSLDATHAVSYSYYATLITGEEWFADATVDLGMNLAHQEIFGYQQQRPPWSVNFNSAAPTAQYTGLLGQWQDYGDQRHFGWSWLIQGHAFGIMPADHQFRTCADALIRHNGDFIQANLDYFPADVNGSAIYTPDGGTSSSPWQIAFQAMGAYFHYMLNEDTRWQRVGDFCANWTLTLAENNRWYAWDMFRAACRAQSTAWNATSNPYLPVMSQGYLSHWVSLDTNAVFTQFSGSNWADSSAGPPIPRNGDRVLLTKTDEGGGQSGGLPPGIADGTWTYRVNVANAQNFSAAGNSTGPQPYCTFQLSLTQGGAPMTFGGATATDCNMALIPLSVAEPAFQVVGPPAAGTQWPYYFAWDNYIPPNMTVLCMARHVGNPRVTTAIRDAAIAFIAPNVGQANSTYVSTFDSVAIV